MKALRLVAVENARMQDVDRPAPADDEALIQVERAGICGTDLEIYTGAFPSRPPVTMGHEYSGIVRAVGSSVSNVRPGERVVSSGAWVCGQCAPCRRGQPGLCEHRSILGSSADGVFAEFFTAPARILLPIPDTLEPDDAQSALALAICLHAVARVPRGYARNVALTGPGHLGLLLLQLLGRTFGAPVSLFGTRPERLALGEELGAAETVLVPGGVDERARSYDLVFETAGTGESFLQAIELAEPGGTVVIVGVAKSAVDGFHPNVLYHKELTILGSKGGSGYYADAVRLMAEKAVRAAPLITHRFPVAEADRALAAALDRDQMPVRVVMENDGQNPNTKER